MVETVAAFYDERRMRFSDVIPPRSEHGSFMVGYYESSCEGGADGEFRITLHELGREDRVCAKVEAFDDSVHAIIRLQQEHGLVDALQANAQEQYEDKDEFARLLLELGLKDFSDQPLPGVE